MNNQNSHGHPLVEYNYSYSEVFIETYHISEFVLRLCYSLCVTRVNNKYQPLRVLVVVAPQRPDLVLAADVPHRETYVFILHRLHIEPDCRYSGHDFTKF